MKTYLAHFVNQDGSSGGGQDVKAETYERALIKAERAAKRLGKKFSDLTGPEEE